MNPLYLFILLTLISCSEGRRRPIRIKEGLCVQEINKLYISSSLGRGSMYKIVNIDSGEMKLNRWYNNGWYTLGMKDDDYFKETLRFRFVKIGCPGAEGTSKAGIGQRIKKIEI